MENELQELRDSLEEDILQRVLKQFGENSGTVLNRAVTYYLTRYGEKVQTTMPLNEEDIGFLRVYCSYTGRKRTQVMSELVEKADIPQHTPERATTLYSAKPKVQCVSFNITKALWEKLDEMARVSKVSKALVMEKLLAGLRLDIKGTTEGRVINDMITRQKEGMLKAS